jgi:putative ABC transport system permease protein
MQDLRLAFRALLATPIVTAVAVLSLALGIGANTAIFSLVNSLIPRTLPVADPERLVILSGRRNNGARPAFSYATYDEIRRHRQGFDGTLAFSDCCEQMTLRLGGEAHPVNSFFVSGDFFGNLVLCGCAAYRTQLFLYLKACGREELNTMNLWAGGDAPAAV